ncbi:MAG: hypothetical protein IJ272_09775 [Clostridia bacterium]|nr:hypothetical protein [Clostridia bacterium]
MGKYFRTVYLYIVAFATLCMVIAGFVGTVNGIVSYVYPVVDEYAIEDVYYDYDYDTEEFVKEDVDYITRIEDLEKVEQRTSLKEAFTYLAVLVCGLPLYVFHIKQIKKESEKGV